MTITISQNDTNAADSDSGMRIYYIQRCTTAKVYILQKLNSTATCACTCAHFYERTGSNMF